MDVLAHPNGIYLSAAQGWLELGNWTEALAELEQIGPEWREHPDVLQVRWQVAVKAERWPEALAVAESLCRTAPDSPFGWIHRSYCLHELHRTQEAWDALFPLAERFPREWLISYNLACYACQLGNLEEAKSWLARAVKLGDRTEIERLAEQDGDLKPLFQKP